MPLSKGAIAGIVIGAVIVVAVGIWAAVYFSKKSPAQLWACDSSLGTCSQSSTGNYGSLTDCQTACVAPASSNWACDTTSGSCSKSASGTYKDQTSCNTACKVGVYSYNCDGAKGCSQVPGAGGSFSDQNTCENSCKLLQCDTTIGTCTAASPTYNNMNECKADCNILTYSCNGGKGCVQVVGPYGKFKNLNTCQSTCLQQQCDSTSSTCTASSTQYNDQSVCKTNCDDPVYRACLVIAQNIAARVLVTFTVSGKSGPCCLFFQRSSNSLVIDSLEDVVKNENQINVGYMVVYNPDTKALESLFYEPDNLSKYFFAANSSVPTMLYEFAGVNAANLPSYSPAAFSLVTGDNLVYTDPKISGLTAALSYTDGTKLEFCPKAVSGCPSQPSDLSITVLNSTTLTFLTAVVPVLQDDITKCCTSDVAAIIRWFLSLTGPLLQQPNETHIFPNLVTCQAADIHHQCPI
jgi:hypothetical protein